MKRYFVFFLCGLFLFPEITTAKDGTDTLSLPKSSLLQSSRLSPTKSAILEKYENSVYSAKTILAGKPKKKFFNGIRYSGYARAYFFYRNMSQYNTSTPTTNGLTQPVNLGIDDGYQQPMFLLQLEANPTQKSYFQTQIMFNNYMLRTLATGTKTDTIGHYANLFVIYKLEGSVDTRFGKFKMTAGGGANWFRLSQATLWQYQYRDDMFERYPFEPEGSDFGRYNSYYSSGTVPWDQRFGMQATQGFILEGTNMPGGLEASVLYGKTSTSGGFQSYLVSAPQNMFGGKVAKTIGNHKIAYNYFNQFGYYSNTVKDSGIVRNGNTYYVENNRTSQTVTTVEGRFNFDKFTFFTEVGMGAYLSNTYNGGLRKNAKAGLGNVSQLKRNWGETMFFELDTKRELTGIPLKLSYYRISGRVVNNSSSVANTSIEQAKPTPTTPDQYYINYFDGMVTEVGQLANNRQGVNLNAAKNFIYDKLKTKLDFGIAQELINLAGDKRNGARKYAISGIIDTSAYNPYTNSITFQHKLNSITRSRFAFYERFQGPYGRSQTIYRRSFDNVAITDRNVNYKKSFSTIDLSLKYKFRIFGRELIMTSFSNCSSVQTYWSPIPVFSNKAFIRYFYEEYLAFFSLSQKVTLVGFLGYERVLGNMRTELADANGNLITDGKGNPIYSANGKPVNQTGHGYGLGIDYNFHQRASLHLRNRVFNYKDKNFTRDKMSGDEMTVELKVFF